MTRNMRYLATAMALSTAVCIFASSAPSAPREPAGKPAPQELELFQAMEEGNLQVRLTAKNDREATITIKNTIKQPVSVQLPAAFVAVPVYAQRGSNTGAFGSGGTGGGGNQAAGGGIGGGGGGFGGGGGGMQGGGGGGFFNIAPEGVGKIKVALVCLEHGKDDPNVRVNYRMQPVDSFSKDPRVYLILKLLGEGRIPQRAAQVAAWHYTDEMTWQQLAAKKINRLGRADEPFFSQQEMQAGVQIAAEVERLARESGADAR